ncbi:TraG family conjugative transposon ATPase [Croceitalea sp. MTPC9]|uniref:TraG/VirB4 family ATPase n=1 Tax=unclassified Croceitalea TaxID=2632280 RepID=UPI002B3E302B|nr:TraG family conjugative transposon ATPase [Croceitalea sp. MTPC6]GMN18482.1 TraG family conjugative transposon ATPase [Croceitalea sp. MTPC9]
MENAFLSKNPPTLRVDGNSFLSSNGDVVCGYSLQLPEVFTLSKEDYNQMHEHWFRTLRFLPKYSFVHKMDIFLKERYDGQLLPNDTFIQRTTRDYFNGREHFTHYPFLFIGNRGGTFLKNSSIHNPFKKLPNIDKLLLEFERDNHFLEDASKAIDFINTSKHIKAVPMSADEIYALQENYFNAFQPDVYLSTDMKAKSNKKSAIDVGGKLVGSYSLDNIKQFPDYVDISKIDPAYSSKKYKFHKGLADDFGFRLPHDHIYNQIIYLEDHTLKKEKLKETSRKLKGSRGFDIENEEKGKILSDYVTELGQDEMRILTQGHTNIIFYADSDIEFTKCARQIETIFKTHDFKPIYPSRKRLKEIYMNSFPALSGSLSRHRMYDSELEINLALFLNVTTYKNDNEGVAFSDRLYNIPTIRDVRDYEKKRIKAWNFTMYGPTGEGKSVLAQHIIRQFNESGYRNVIFDIGGSFKKLALLLPKEKSLFFSFEPGKPLPLNPFKISGSLDAQQLKDLSSFVFKLWLPEEDMSDNIQTSLSRLIETYFKEVISGHSYPSFYLFVKQNKEKLIDFLKIESRFFDMDNFLFLCSKYVGEGQYSYLFGGEDDSSHLIDEKDYIVFEFDKAQDDPVALSILMLMGSQAVKKLVWENKSVPGVIFYDELAKFIKYKSIRDTVVFFYQAIRKQNAAVGSSLQSPAQLPIGDDTNAMIDNTQVVYVLFNEKGYAPLVERFNLSEHQHNILKSLTSIRDGDKNYTEFALIIGSEIWPLRLELPPEVLKLYQTDGAEYEEIMQLYEKYGDMEKTIKEHMKHY